MKIKDLFEEYEIKEGSLNGDEEIDLCVMRTEEVRENTLLFVIPSVSGDTYANKEKFIKQSWDIIGKAQKLIDKRMNRAIEFENEIDALIDRIAIDDSLTDAEIKSIITKIKKLKLESATELSTVIGTLYDKQALANKEATAIVDGNIGIKKFEDL